MNMFTAIALVGAIFVLAVTPGPGVFATVARSLTSGFYQAAAVAAGIVCGDLFFLLLAIYGLSAVAKLLGDFFLVVKYAGGLYLIFLGLRIWLSPTQHTKIRQIHENSWKKNFISGLAITLGNPKVILFYLGFLPTFLDLEHLDRVDIFFTAVIVSLVLGSVLLGYGYGADRARSLFTSTRSLKNLNRSSGAIMMSTGSLILIRS
jgi:threonine/homoserine/homoserine lactone efflux protein